MEAFNQFIEVVTTLQSSDQILTFINDNLLRLIYVGLAFGFAVLLVEIRLPLKYYWDLPTFMLRSLLSDFGLLKRPPIWGYCLDSKTHHIIPITAIELLDQDSKEIIKTTYSNRLGQYGFAVKPGRFIVRAVKNHYSPPPFYDPENIRLEATDESLALPVEIKEGEDPNLNVVLQPMAIADNKKALQQIVFYFRAFAINLANGMLALSVIGSWYGWVVTKSPLFAVLLAVGIVFMFIKIYILEAVGVSSKEVYA